MTRPPSDTNLDKLVAFAGVLADAAAALTVPLFHRDIAVDDKGGKAGFDPVTEADRSAEEAMRALISKHFPEHGVIGEEFPDKPAASGWTWTLDPIDGTRGFICGAPTWTTLIACSFEGRPVIGVIDQPVLADRFLGRPGGAVRHRDGGDTRLAARQGVRLADAIVACTDPAMFDASELGAFEQIRRTARLTRYGLDAYAYAQLAAGRIDMVVESSMKPCDTAALIPVVEGAGGVITDWRGRPRPVEGQIAAAGDPACLEEALTALRRSAV